MPSAIIDGIATRYEILGSGPPLLMYAPGGFNAVVEAWSTLGIYAKIKLLDHLPRHYTCIMFDRRECGQSGGRVERVSWAQYVAQGRGLLDHLRVSRAHLMGGCMGCAPVVAFAVAHPDRVASMILYWPVGGAKYRISSHQRFAEHLDFVQSDGLAGVVALVRRDGKLFGADPRGGPWASVIKRDDAFASAFAAQDGGEYVRICAGMRRCFVRPRYRAGRRAGRPDAHRYSGADRAGPRRRARDLGGALSRRMPAAIGLLGHAGRWPDRSRDQRAHFRFFE